MPSITITLTTEQATRVQDALAHYEIEDYRSFLISKTKQIVRSAEKAEAEAARIEDELEIT
jgi:hypothetical protein